MRIVVTLRFAPLREAGGNYSPLRPPLKSCCVLVTIPETLLIENTEKGKSYCVLLRFAPRAEPLRFAQRCGGEYSPPATPLQVLSRKSNISGRVGKKRSNIIYGGGGVPHSPTPPPHPLPTLAKKEFRLYLVASNYNIIALPFFFCSHEGILVL